jgi:hypothetical protein
MYCDFEEDRPLQDWLKRKRSERDVERFSKMEVNQIEILEDDKQPLKKKCNN